MTESAEPRVASRCTQWPTARRKPNVPARGAAKPRPARPTKKAARKAPAKPAVELPPIADDLDYSSLTLAQLRARMPSLSVSEPEGTAGLRGAVPGPRPIPDPVGQQDHPRDRQVTSAPAPGSAAENPFPVPRSALPSAWPVG